jgi:hypothetical protein
LRSGSPRSTGANDDGGERNTAVGARPTGASADAADRCIAVGTDAEALGMFARGIVAAEMADPWNTCKRGREAKSREGTPSR